MSEQESTLDEFVGDGSEVDGKRAEELARKTVCGIPPSDWSVVRLGEAVSVVSGNSLPTEYQDESGGEHPVYKVSDMNESENQKYVSTVDNRLSKEDLEELNHTLYPEKTTILPKVGAALLTNKRRMLTEPSSFDNNVMGWVPEEINPEFLYYVSCMVDMEAVAQKGAVPSISKAIAQSLKVPSPPLEEQRKIASVLYTVDQAIQKTDEVINQVERVKIGLMQDLFRTGIDDPETKELRRIGRVPEHWDVVKLGDVCKKITDGTHKSPPTIEDGYPYITSQNVRDWGFDLDDLKYISEEDHSRITSRCNPEPGDVLYVKDGANTGNVNINTLDFEFSLLSSVALIKPDRDKLKPWFLKYLCSWPKFRELILSQMSGTGIRRLTISKLEKTDILLPPIEEQTRIVELLDEYYSYHQNQREWKNKLKQLKKGLMQDLLSGEVRTHDKDIELINDVLQHG